MKLPPFYTLLITVGLLVFVSCNSNENKPPADATIATKPVASLSCTDTLHPEMPTGAIIFENTDTTERTLSSIEIGKDSIKWFNYEKDPAKANSFKSVEITTMALKDIDPAGVETTEGDIDLTDGSKLHTTGFFLRAYQEEKLFRNKTYDCSSNGSPYSEYDVHTCNISTNNMTIAKQLVDKIKPLLPVKPKG